MNSRFIRLHSLASVIAAVFYFLHVVGDVRGCDWHWSRSKGVLGVFERFSVYGAVIYTALFGYTYRSSESASIVRSL